jgi:photosystem II stability/assembly factor-like uncharacterized protein
VKKLCFLVLSFFLALFFVHAYYKTNLFSTLESAFEKEEKRKQDQPDKFLLFHRGIRTAEGESAPGYSSNYKWTEVAHARTRASLRKKISGGRTKSNGVLEWKERGPGNVPGRTRAVYCLPGEPLTWLAGSATGGLWKTTNGGNSWTNQSGNIPALPISSFAANSTGTVIYAGSGEFVSSLYSAIGNGIFISTDKGDTWNSLPFTKDNPDFSIVTRIVTDPANAQIVLATTVPHNQSPVQTSAIWRSEDGGQNWSKIKEVVGFFEQIVATPGSLTNFNTLYASQKFVGVWRSLDAGKNWELCNKGMTTNGRVEIAVSPVNKNVVFASAEGTLSGKESDLYYSPDAGNTWRLVDVKFNNNVIDFFEGQGFYDNTIMCDPFDEDIVYFGGVSLFRSTVENASGSVDNFQFVEVNTKTFLSLQSLDGIDFDSERLTVGSQKPTFDVEIRFDPALTQKAHRFLVPANRTSGVLANEYVYQGYPSVPFQVWDVTNNRQLMVSFRDQNRNGVFDLVTPYLTSNGNDALQNSREYLYIHNLAYNTSPHSSIDQAGGQEVSLAYNFFPALPQGGTWNPSASSILKIKHFSLQKFTADTKIVADGRSAFDQTNKSNQVNLDQGVHPDHHCLLPVITNATAKTYKFILGNDGGVFVSKPSTTPGTTEGDWSFKGSGYNTSQFYGADKRPGADQYIGGMQDNGTRLSPKGESASALSKYLYGLGGDGFEVIWNSKNPDKILGSIYNGAISRSINGGETWQDAVNGLSPGNEFPFVTKLANSKDFPERVFTAGTQGVYVSENFGSSWQLRPIASKFVISTPLFLDVEVSRANANIVWAGSGMNNAGTLRNLHVSKDGGKTFAATNNFTAVPMGNITKLASHPTQPNTAYALFSFADRPKILRTTDLGQTWEDLTKFGVTTESGNLFPDIAVYCLYVHPQNPDIIWVGTELGIVESQDNGESWDLLEDFPNVSVWDMKGQDDQIVIATHGRGIWTATMDQIQTPFPVPEIVTAGTSPQEKLMIRIESPGVFDSLQILIGSSVMHRLYNVQPGTEDIALTNIIAGEKELRLVSYKGNAPFQSFTYAMKHLDILTLKNSYATYFNAVSDLTLSGLTSGNLPGENTHHRKNLLTTHPYEVGKTYQLIIRTPITVSSTLPVMYYGDIAIVEPGNDQVRIEATKNGLDWVPLRQPYDAAFDGDTDGNWLAAFVNHQNASSDMIVHHEVDISKNFSAGDLLLFRMQMNSSATVTAWGWAVNYISIQEPPLSTEQAAASRSLSLYPNPTKGAGMVDYRLDNPSEVTVSVVDIFGRTLQSKFIGMKDQGSHTEIVDLHGYTSGTYLIVLHTAEGKKTGKIIRSE